MAAGGLFALDHHMGDLCLDIDRARRLAAALSETSTFAPIGHPDSNIVVAQTIGWEAEAALAALSEKGLRAMAFGVSRVRFVLHRDITDEAFEAALAAVRAVRP